LKNFDSSLSAPISPSLSVIKLSWIFFFVLRNSSTIKSLFFGSFIFRNDIFYSITKKINAIFIAVFIADFIAVFNTDFNSVFIAVFNAVFNADLKRAF